MYVLSLFSPFDEDIQRLLRNIRFLNPLASFSDKIDLKFLPGAFKRVYINRMKNALLFASVAVLLQKNALAINLQTKAIT